MVDNRPNTEARTSPVNRRHVIGGVAVGVLSLAGCLGSAGTRSGTDSPTTTRSSPTTTPSETPRDGVVAFGDLSPEAQTEVERTLQREGMYSECGPLTIEQELDLDREPRIEYQGTLYEPAVMVGAGGKDDDDCEEHFLQLTRIETATTTATADKTVAFETLPESAQDEVRHAIQEDVYTACEPLALADEIDPESPPWITYDGAYYRPVIETRAAKPDAPCDTVHSLRMRHR